MDVNDSLKQHVRNPTEFPLKEVTLDGVEYLAFGDNAFKKDTPTTLQVYQKDNEYYSLESLVVFMKHQNENHGVYVKEAAAANVQAVTRIDN